MKLLVRRSVAVGCLFLWAAAGAAESVVEYAVSGKGQSGSQPVLIREGRLLVKSAGGDHNLDLLYQRNEDQVILIDHKKRSFTPVTQKKVEQLARQTEELQPVVRGLGEQLRKLSPKQRQKWSDMLGGVDLDQLSGVKTAAASTRIVQTGGARKIAGISCKQLDIIRGEATEGQLCLAEPEGLKLPEDDSATLQALLKFGQKVASRAQGLAGQFGISLPARGLGDFDGVPIEIRDLSGKHPITLTLSRITQGTAGGEELRIPEGYQPKDLALWH